MEKKIMNYEAPEATVFGVETQNCFASGGQVESMQMQDVGAWDE